MTAGTMPVTGQGVAAAPKDKLSLVPGTWKRKSPRKFLPDPAAPAEMGRHTSPRPCSVQGWRGRVLALGTVLSIAFQAASPSPVPLPSSPPPPLPASQKGSKTTQRLCSRNLLDIKGEACREQ